MRCAPDLLPAAIPRSDLEASAADDNGGMSLAVNWIVRLGLLAGTAVYVAVFLAGYPGLKIAALAVTALNMAIWALADRSAATRDQYPPVLICAFAATIVVAALASITPNGGTLLVLSFIAALSVGRHVSLPVGWVIGLLPVIAVVVAELTKTSQSWGEVATVAGTVLGAMLIGQNSRTYRIRAEQAAVLLAQAEQLRQEQARTAALDERARIAREVHDVLAHSLGALSLQIQTVRAVLTDSGDVPRAVDLLDQASRMASDGLGETRRAVHALRGEIRPLPQGLAELSATHQRRHGAPVAFEVSGEPRVLSPDAGLAITRAAQEALVNTAKHAPHEPVEMRLDYSPAATRLVVTNHVGAAGSGTEPDLATVNGGYGLAGMRERLLLQGGALTAGRKGSNWVVEATVPQ
jgi:signal transduction histidine kinase